MEGYCVNCKAKKDREDAETTTLKNGRKAMKCKCSDCDADMFKTLGK